MTSSCVRYVALLCSFGQLVLYVCPYVWFSIASILNNWSRSNDKKLALRWRHNEPDGVSDHQPHDCLLNPLFGRRSKKTSKLRVTGLCAGNSPGTGEFSAQRPVTRKMFPFDDVIMGSFSSLRWVVPDWNIPPRQRQGNTFACHCCFLDDWGQVDVNINFQVPNMQRTYSGLTIECCASKAILVLGHSDMLVSQWCKQWCSQQLC